MAISIETIPEMVARTWRDLEWTGQRVPKQGIDHAVVILDGRVPHATMLELFTEQGAGSLMRSTEPRVKPHGLRQGGSGL